MAGVVPEEGLPLPVSGRHLSVQANWGASVTNLALLVAVGVNKEGFRQVLAVEVVAAAPKKSAAYASLCCAGFWTEASRGCGWT